MLRTAKVISFKELEEAWAKRTKKDVAREAKGKAKRSRKRKVVLEGEEATAKTARRGRKRKRTKLKTLKPLNLSAPITNALKLASALVIRASKT